MFRLFNPIINGVASKSRINLYPLTVFYFSSNVSPKTIDPILDFFHNYGFTDTQIKKFIHKAPSVCSIKTIKPKFEHLLKYGFSSSDLIRIICYYPNLLSTSLKEKMIPNLSFLEAAFCPKDHVIKAIINGPWLLRARLEKSVMPNLKILRENCISMDKINYLFAMHPLALSKHPNVMIEVINKLKELGLKPSTSAFVHGINGMACMKKETWERKMKLFETFGWSEKDTLLAFSRQPLCVRISDEKIKKNMDFFTEKLDWDSTVVLRWPIVLGYSLEKRIIPRCAVLSVLAKNGIWNRKPKVSLFTMAEKLFKKRFVDKYEREVPQVLDAHQGKLEFEGFEPMVQLTSQSEDRVVGLP